ncbi:hypothetical protein HII31_01736 [Pseudocercospora fuligena]|uniref:Uncharacterized protein n=1 Tax=Pseudocercospora fuligena TaxID=685502 RepID=A0A8H6RT17_9PEZI|nr:hypothetical protein HII31_01736 [Pseudocercospora fuligena]
MFLRAERQVLHRLPQSGAIVFCVRQYIYAIRNIKEEGSGEAFAEAIDGLKLGNAPDIYYYKRAAEWGDAVKRYLRS